MLALWWAHIVATGCAPGHVGTCPEAQNGKANNGASHEGTAPLTAEPNPTEHQTYCKDAEKPKDCVLALRSAEASERQADFARYSFWTTVAAVGLSALGLLFLKRTLDATTAAAVASNMSADAAIKGNQLNRQIFESSERPWIKVDMAIGGPLTYDVNGLHCAILFALTNVGKSPATYVQVSPRFTTFTGTTINPRSEQKRHLAQLKSQPHSGFGYMIFPGETKRQRYLLSIPKDTIEEAKKELSFATPTIEGFVTYNFVFDQNVHVTSFAASINRKDMPRPPADIEPRSTTAIFFDDGDMPIEHLVLGWYPMSEEYAD